MNSVWLREALESEASAQVERLDGDRRADVCIVGGGFTGLWTAFELKTFDEFGISIDPGRSPMLDLDDLDPRRTDCDNVDLIGLEAMREAVRRELRSMTHG